MYTSGLRSISFIDLSCTAQPRVGGEGVQECTCRVMEYCASENVTSEMDVNNICMDI